MSETISPSINVFARSSHSFIWTTPAAVPVHRVDAMLLAVRRDSRSRTLQNAPPPDTRFCCAQSAAGTTPWRPRTSP